ncbi:MAG TPA: hypothetical protein VHQ86_02210 [Candidatus Saccharimonadia bacterium]|nr:hypothetical protein [Candidatus Saccharimonadia bacterium]
MSRAARRRTTFVASIVAGVLLTSACTASTSPTAPSALTNREHATVGFSTGDVFGSMAPGKVDTYFANLAKTGVHLVRIDVKMSDVERVQGGVPDWGESDTVVQSATRHGLWVHAILDSQPGWATDTSCRTDSWRCAPAGSPTEVGTGAYEFVQFAKAAASRYCSSLRTAEVLNEANAMSSYWGNPGAYGRLYIATYQAIQSGCPTARVSPSGTAAVGTSNPDEGYRPDEWYTRLCAEPGYAQVGTIASLHPYTWPESPSGSDTDSQWTQLLAVNEVLKTNCQITSPVLDISEMGWPTGGGNGPSADVRYPRWRPNQSVTPYRQAQFLADTFDQVARLRTDHFRIEEVLVYSFEDLHSGSTSVEDNFGVVRDDGSPKTLTFDAAHPPIPTAMEVVSAAAGRA